MHLSISIEKRSGHLPRSRLRENQIYAAVPISGWMVFTPFHLGPGLLLGLLLLRWLSLPGLLVGSVIVDARILLAPLGAWPTGGYDPLHTLIGAAWIGLVVSIPIYYLAPRLNWLLEPLGLAREETWRRVLPATIIGAVIHIMLDAFTYPDIEPFIPAVPGNPALGLVDPGTVALLTTACFVATLPLMLYRMGAAERNGE